MSYVTKEELEARLGAELNDYQTAYFSDVLSPAIDEYLQNQTYTLFSNTTQSDEYVSGNGSNLLVIPTMSEVIAVYQVSEDGTETLVDSSAYSVYPRGKSYIYAIRNTTGTWSDGFDNYRVAGKVGYADVPADIKAVALELAINDLNANINNYKSERVGEWAVTYGESKGASILSDASMKVLEGYRRLSRGV